MQKIILFVLLLVTAVSARAEGNQLTSPADLERIEQLQRRVDKLSFGPLGPDNYTLCKARAWLDMALIEYHEQDRTGIVQHAVEQTAQLLHKLDTDPAYMGWETPHPYASEEVRNDLWQIAERLKGSKQMVCTGCLLAKLEVQLVWAGHDKWEAGWGHAEPFARIAENLAYEAAYVGGGKCMAVQPAPAAETIIIKKHTLITAVLFDFDLSLVTDAQQKLDDIIAQLKTWKQIDNIQLSGHADRLNDTGGSDYNQKLSQRRVDFIKDYLVKQGFNAALMTAAAMGDTQPVVGCEKLRINKQDRNALIKCLQPNRRVDIIVEGVR